METEKINTTELNKDFKQNLEKNELCTKKVNRAISIKTAALRKRYLELRVEKDNFFKDFLVLCRYCQSPSKIRDWGFIQRTYYIQPSGCSGGDYDTDLKTEVCDISCSLCGSENYIYNHPQSKDILEIIERNSVDIFKSKSKKPRSR